MTEKKVLSKANNNVLRAVVMDASALLAIIFKESGEDIAKPLLSEASISAINLAEVAKKAVQRGATLSKTAHLLARLPVEVIPFETKHAYQVATLQPLSRRFDLSLADCACIATGQILKQPVVTADRIWAELGLDLEVILIR